MSIIEKLETRIIAQCVDSDGLLLLIRDNKFDDDKYHELIQTLTEYTQALTHQKFLSRKVAGFLRTIEDVFEGSVMYYDRLSIASEEARKISNAHTEILGLMDSIFDVNLEG